MQYILGPETWHNDYPLANGSHQSPVDIESDKQTFEQELMDRPLSITYASCSQAILSNTGSSFMVALGQNCGLYIDRHKVALNLSFQTLIHHILNKFLM